MTIQTAITRVGFLSLFFTTVWMASSAANVISAWMLSQKVSLDVALFQQMNPETATISFSETLGAVEKAITLLPYDTDLRTQAGDAWYLSAFFEKDNTVRDKNAERAIMHYESAIELRSAWPYHYVDLYDLYSLTDRPIEKQVQMLRGVVKFGLWDRDLKYFLLEQAVLLEKSLPQDLLVVREDLQRYLESDSKSESHDILEELRRTLPVLDKVQ